MVSEIYGGVGRKVNGLGESGVAEFNALGK